MLKFLFVVIILLWACMGGLSWFAPKDRVNWEGLIFLSIIPLLPIFAGVCGLL